MADGKISWGSVALAVIAAVPPTIMALAAYNKAQDTHDAVNSRMTELLAIAKQNAASKATLDEKEAQHVREGEQAISAQKKTDPKK